MSKQFVEGNVYVFTKKKFIKSAGKASFIDCKSWVDKINGNKVIPKYRSSGEAGKSRLFISPDWCKCIKNNNPKFKEEN